MVDRWSSAILAVKLKEATRSYSLSDDHKIGTHLGYELLNQIFDHFVYWFALFGFLNFKSEKRHSTKDRTKIVG